MVVHLVKNPPTMQETRVQFLGGEDPLEKEMSTHSSMLTWEIPWTEVPGRLHTVHGVTQSWTQLSNETTTTVFMEFVGFTALLVPNAEE